MYILSLKEIFMSRSKEKIKTKKCIKFGEFLHLLRKTRQVKAASLALEIGISQAHYSRLEGGFIPPLRVIEAISKALDLDSISSKLLCAYAGYPSRSVKFLKSGKKYLTETQEAISSFFYRNSRLIRDVSISRIPSEFEILEYSENKFKKIQDGTDKFIQSAVSEEEFFAKKRERQQSFFKYKIPSQFIVLSTLFEKSVLVPKEIMCRQIDEILKYCEQLQFLELRLLEPGLDVYPPYSNFRLYGTDLLWLMYIPYGEIVSYDHEPELIELFEGYFYWYWNKALPFKESLQKLQEIQESLRQ